MKPRKLTRQEEGLIVTLNFNHNGQLLQRTASLLDVGYEYTESFQIRMLEAFLNDSDEEIRYSSPYAHQPISGSITGHVEDEDQFEVEPENELDAIWNGGGSMKFTEEDWGY